MDQYNILSPQSRVWIYQSNRGLSPAEEIEINEDLSRFAQAWTSHSQQLRSFAKVFHGHFIVLLVDESMAGASGCSIDKSVHFVQELQRKHDLNLMDRMTFAYRDQGEIHLVSAAEFANLYRAGQLTEDSLVFDNLIKTKAEMESQWEKPIKDSWHTRFV